MSTNQKDEFQEVDINQEDQNKEQNQNQNEPKEGQEQQKQQEKQQEQQQEQSGNLYPPLPSNKTIFASNISVNATESSLRDFFGICGTITKLSVALHEDKKSKAAIIVFENEEAAKTALFLNETFIIDRAIKVVPYNAELPKQSGKNQNQNNNQQQQQQQAQQSQQPQQQPQQPSTLTNFLASAYMFGASAFRSAQQFDQKYQITNTINEKAKQVDQSLKISETTQKVSKSLTDAANNFDKRFKITENTNKFANSVQTASANTWNALTQRNEKTKAFFAKLDQVGKNINNTFEDAMKRAQKKVDILKEEIARRENQQQNNQSQQQQQNNETNTEQQKQQQQQNSNEQQPQQQNDEQKKQQQNDEQQKQQQNDEQQNDIKKTEQLQQNQDVQYNEQPN